MPSAWVPAPPDTVLREVAAGLAERSGAALIGADGVGKTLAARRAAENVASGGVRWVVGTATQRTVPLGAFCALLAGADIADDARPTELLRAAQDHLTGAGAGRLLVVDDAHLLDHVSATLVYQLALSGSARLIVTVRADRELPDAIAALWADELLTRVQVEPLDRATTATLLESALDTPPDETTIDEAFARSQGNPLHLRHLVSAGDLRTRASLDELIDGYLSGLPAPVPSVLDHLALAEPLRRSDLTALAKG